MIRILILIIALTALPQTLAAEVLIYRTPTGERLFTDRPMSGPGYHPMNAAARQAGKKLSQRMKEIDTLIYRLAPRFSLDADLVRAVVAVESNYDVRARSSRNAMGLMQLIPATAERFGVSDPYDPEQNLTGGMAYLQWLLAHFRGNVRYAVAAYNAGENAVAKYGGVPPYPETQRYVEKIRLRYDSDLHPYSVGIANPWQPARQDQGQITLSGS
ncbi:MAG: lytic transglycosylase domain-containing protein [Gammaproteobacteria bacterium]|nr:lytic transglycosylase domain-containing protein [Gammaproteobacteria bacterium]